MHSKEFIAHAALGTSYFDGIEIMINDNDNDVIYHRHFYYDSDGKKMTSRIAMSEIRYAKPEWSDEQEPYFVRHGRREYLSNYMSINR
ncbi:MAG: hypothetical protein WCR86_13540 [Parabacteroides sp.]